MLEKLKSLTLKSKIIFGVVALAILAIITCVILYFCSVINLIGLFLAICFSILGIAVANLFNYSIKDDKKLFIYNLVITILIFACCVSFVVLIIVNPGALTK